ncbi:MAG: YraN family protein [Tannerella sp.]|jgi:putative endonuclease|nr:YraN family protein [Tannerella sp.]
MTERNITGKTGEEAACSYLKAGKYRILHTNWRFRRYELDIVAESDDALVVVEVKTRSANYLVAPEEAIDRTKIKRIACAAEAYQLHFGIDLPIRFDVICLIRTESAYVVESHIEDAFYAPVNCIMRRPGR